MKKKFFALLVCMMFFSVKLFSETPFMLYYSLTPKNNKPASIMEFMFDQDGIISSAIQYDINEFVDYNYWQTYKSKAKVLSFYFVERNDDCINVYEYKNNQKYLVKKIDLNDSELLYTDVPALFLNGKLKKSSFYDYERKETISISYDDQRQEFSIVTPDNLEGFKYLCDERYYVSGFINFSSLAKKVNKEICPWLVVRDFMLCTPLLPKDVYEYSDDKSYFYLSGDKMFIKSGIFNEQLSKVTIDFENHFILDSLRKVAMFVNGNDVCVVYIPGEKNPLMIGTASDSKVSIVPIKSVRASSYLKEKKVSYIGDNIIKLKLDEPWVEGVDGNGIGEYLEFSKDDATGMYVMNGFVSWEKKNLYTANNRIQGIEISGLTSGKKVTVILMDSPELQYVSLDGFSNEKIRITIKSVYAGEKYDDTCLGGIILVKEK